MPIALNREQSLPIQFRFRMHRNRGENEAITCARSSDARMMNKPADNKKAGHKGRHFCASTRRLKRNSSAYDLVGRVGFEPTTSFRRRIMSPLPATNTASGPTKLRQRQRQQKSPVCQRPGFSTAGRHTTRNQAGLTIRSLLSLALPTDYSASQARKPINSLRGTT